MNDKYEFTGVSIDFWGKKLYQIKAKKSFWNVNKWDLGWYIEKEKNLSVSDNAWVSDNARVYGDARVYDNAIVSGNANVYDNAKVFGNASVSDNARVYDNARVFGDACVYGNVRVHNDAWAYSNADARLNDNAWLLAKNNYSKWSFNSITIELTPEQIKKVRELLE